MLAVDSFLMTVLRSGLLNRDQLQDALRDVPREDRSDPATLANYLVKVGKVTRFQASMLLEGVSQGLLFGPYQVLAPLGRGGMGIVYLARDSRNQHLLALKVLPAKRAREEDRLLARFRREMDLNQRVSHPHLARFYEAGVKQGVHYIAMEYIPGQSLHRLVSDEGPLEVPRAARLFAEVTLGLEHAHSRDLVHRDLKPSNLMITPNDHAKVLDLGLAIIQGEVPEDRTIVGGQGYVVGTMDYLAPEQAGDVTQVDPRSDVYSLGCTLYFALTGQPPFPGGTALQKIKRHMNEEPIPVTELNPAVPPGFAALVQKMMAKDPQDRFVSAVAVCNELLAWTSGEPTLPLDQEGDEHYQEAIVALEGEELWSHLAASNAPPPLPAPVRRGRPSLRAFLDLFNQPGQRPAPAWSGYLLTVEIGALVVVGVGLMFLVYLLAQ